MKNGSYDLMDAEDNYPGKKYRGRYCQIHQDVFWKNTGNVAKSGEVIHHKNGDKRDNRIENLELKKNSDHAREHSLSMERIIVTIKCPNCSIILSFPKNKVHSLYGRCKARFCTRKCSGEFVWKKIKDKEFNAEQRIRENIVSVERVKGGCLSGR